MAHSTSRQNNEIEGIQEPVEFEYEICRGGLLGFFQKAVRVTRTFTDKISWIFHYYCFARSNLVASALLRALQADDWSQ